MSPSIHATTGRAWSSRLFVRRLARACDRDSGHTSLGSRVRRLLPFLLLLLCALPVALSAQGSGGGGGGGGGGEPPTCLPDCFDSTWGPRQVTTVTLANGCKMSVYYRTRLACGIWQDVLIDEIVTFDYHAPCYPQSINWNPASVVSEVTQLLLIQNPMNFEPNQIGEPCASNWRVTVGGCWRASSEPWNPNLPHIFEHTWFFPCTPTICCLSLYRVCIDASGNRTFTRLPSDPSQPTCESMPNGDECVPVCDGFN